MKFNDPIERFLPIIIKDFKQSVFKYKQRKIKTCFIPYYYGTLAGMLVVEKRKLTVAEKRVCNWLG